MTQGCVAPPWFLLSGDGAIELLYDEGGWDPWAFHHDFLGRLFVGR